MSCYILNIQHPQCTEKIYSAAKELIRNNEYNDYNEWLCDTSYCCHQTRFWALNAPKMRLCGLGPHWGSLQRSPRHPSCVWGGRFAAGKGRGGKGNGSSQLWEQINARGHAI